MASKKSVKKEETKNNEKNKVSRGKFVEENNFKKPGIKRVFMSFKYSIDGLKYAYTHEQSLLLHIFALSFVLICGFIFKINATQWVITIVMGGMITVAELFNTAIEAVVDMVTEEYHPLAKVAKDTASGLSLIHI